MTITVVWAVQEITMESIDFSLDDVCCILHAVCCMLYLRLARNVPPEFQAHPPIPHILIVECHPFVHLPQRCSLMLLLLFSHPLLPLSFTKSIIKLLIQFVVKNYELQSKKRQQVYAKRHKCPLVSILAGAMDSCHLPLAARRWQTPIYWKKTLLYETKVQYW